jgi:hypothetical protein
MLKSDHEQETYISDGGQQIPISKKTFLKMDSAFRSLRIKDMYIGNRRKGSNFFAAIWALLFHYYLESFHYLDESFYDRSENFYYMLENTAPDLCYKPFNLSIN